ncbi:hypothetical protein [Acinetobacter baumannii]|uniref:hypothetical protein n=1 Tax=Acinetobacter baumannii TaxID=470 RepID=UPI002ACC0602|nr:hypothetical protein [Acinetobacter baumannii]WQC46019.1 hypothetical protein U0543_07765 [Acinetobacter baumannii]
MEKNERVQKIWGISKAAILYRAKQLNLINENQYKTGIIHLRVSGEAKQEIEDPDMTLETPSLLQDAINIMLDDGISTEEIADKLKISTQLLEKLTGMKLPKIKHNLRVL